MHMSLPIIAQTMSPGVGTETLPQEEGDEATTAPKPAVKKAPVRYPVKKKTYTKRR